MLTSLGLKVESKIESWKTFQFSVFMRKILRLWDFLLRGGKKRSRLNIECCVIEKHLKEWIVHLILIFSVFMNSTPIDEVSSI